MGYFFFDYYYIVLVLPVIIASLIIQARLKSIYSKYSKIANVRNITGAQAAQMVLSYYGIHDVTVEHIAGSLSDHYDPTSKVIRLSDGVFGSSSIAAVGIACHEAGHAAQHAEAYMPIKVRNFILPVCNIGSKLSIPLLIAGMIFSYEPLVWIGIGFFSFVAVFQLVTLPVEFNASRRAISVIDTTDLLYDDEIGGAKKVLFAAAMTYVASMLVALANVLRFALRILAMNSRRRD